MNFFQNLGTTEWIIIIFVLLLVFGKKKLMEWAKGLGESGREMQKVKKEFEGNLHGEDTKVAKNAPKVQEVNKK